MKGVKLHKAGAALLLIFSFCSQREAVATTVGTDDDVIVIRGRRRESVRVRQTGQSVTIKPEDASRFDSITHLKRESSVLAPETSTISPSGFVIPRVRGQDSKLTDVYLEDVLLQDPYAGLPLLEALDLRAFGSLEIHQGVPPPEVPGLNPIGTLRYRFRPVGKSSVSSGLQVGQPFGHSLWGLGVYRSQDPETETDARLYARRHTTNGRYKFYSDEGTPYNTSDDKVRTRENNDQSSLQFTPFFRRKFGAFRFEALGWLYQASRGLPSGSMVVPSAMREQTKGHWFNVRLSREWQLFTPATKLELGGSMSDSTDHRRASDPGQRFLSVAEKSDMQLRSRHASVNMSLKQTKIETFLAYDTSKTAVESRLDERLAGELKRYADVFTLGGRFKPLPWSVFELKTASRFHLDKSAAGSQMPQEETAARSSRKQARAFGASLALGQEDLGLYVQAGYAQRLPSLFEEFGDGAAVRSSHDLKAENIHHREAGAFIKNESHRWQLGTAAYIDQTDHKIVFVPIMANAVKAVNVRRTDLRGVDVRGEWSLYQTTFYVSAARILPYDTTRSPKQVLPGVPQQVVVGEVAQELGSFTLRWLARYRSKVYRDLANSVELPGALTHDASIDYKGSFSQTDAFKLGLSVRNVFNIRSVPIVAADTSASRGKTAYSDVEGSPLPGRQWLASLVWTL